MFEDRYQSGQGSLVRKLNTRLLLGALYRQPPRTVTELVEATGLSRPTVEAIIADLLDSERIDELPPATQRPRAGRPPRLVRFRGDAGYVVGMDVGAHSVLVLAANLEGGVIAEHRATVRPSSGRKPERSDCLAAVGSAVDAALQTGGLNPDQIWEVTVGTIGVVDSQGSVTACRAIDNWTGDHLRTYLQRFFSRPVLVENDANLGAVAEHRCGVAKNAADVVFALVGHRIGAGILIGGNLHRGYVGGAGEIANLPESPWATATRDLVRSVRILRTRSGRHPSAEEVFAAASAGDPSATHGVSRFADAVAEGLAGMILAIDPELVVIGGGISRAGTQLLDPLRRGLAARCLNMPRLETSSLGDTAVACGAVQLALDRIEDRLFLVEATTRPTVQS